MSVGSDSVTAVLIEPVLSVGGVIVPPPGELAGLRALCDRHGISLVADEVATGFGHTGRTFGFEHDLGADGAGSVRRRSAGSVAEEIVELSRRHPSWESSASSTQGMRRPRHESQDRAGLPASPKSDDTSRACL
ncbi:aminotransferase class III-fold pyridoxal phosphate-dependent enzyme [Actinoallomurus sp. NPDC052274]|uniref:aminotransferase class III-fold pyridoxal phosphate-dependent enzyme n=1 Tax=Actinoallomurus sp. NPDC052274 TaxID=3155420 RepID=UPI0034260895